MTIAVQSTWRDPFAVLLVVLGVLLLIAGVLALIGRRRMARNMVAAGVVPSWARSSVGYVVAIGAMQLALGVMGLVVAGIVAR